MHELSIAATIVEVAAEHARDAGGRVAEVTLRVGRLACLQEEALRFGFGLVAAGTPLEGARLSVVDVPVRIWCSTCAAEAELPGIQKFACPRCGHPSGDLRAGRELEIESILIETLTPPRSEPP